MPTTIPILRAAAATALLALAAGVLAGCSGSVTSSDQHWTSASEMRSSSDSDVVPTLVGSDATDIELHQPQMNGVIALRWRSESGITRSDCKPGPITVAASAAEAKWWPSTEPAKGWTCGWWVVFSSDGSYYASKRPAETTTS